jgi:hypothetical protein
MNLGKNKVISVLILILSIALILILGIVIYLYLNYEKPIQIPNKNDIESSISDYLYSERKIENSDIKILSVNYHFARAEIVTEFGLQNVFLRFENGLWKIASFQSNPPFCEKLETFGFPSSMYSDCLFEFPNAKKVSDIKNNSENSEVGEVSEVQIIGRLVIPENPGCNNCFNLTDGEEIIEVTYDITELDLGDFENVLPGDTIVIDTEIKNNNEDEIEIKVNNIQEVGGDEENENTEEDLDLSEEVYYDITDLPPGVAPPSGDFFELLFDRDFSDQDIQIISDF